MRLTVLGGRGLARPHPPVPWNRPGRRHPGRVAGLRWRHHRRLGRPGRRGASLTRDVRMDHVAEELWPRLLAEAWAALDMESSEADDPGGPGALRVTGDPGRLPSRLPVEDTAIACAGAALLAAAALHGQRGGAVGAGRSG